MSVTLTTIQTPYYTHFQVSTDYSNHPQMPIKRIESSSANFVVSSSAIATPVSVVKELIDNSLDANATSVIVEVDTTSIAYIQCQDNGSGVMPGEDRKMMACNSTTSKISSFEDIRNVATLGFRGEALFFMSQLVNNGGKMEISTRTKSDPVAEKWKVGLDGRPVGGFSKISSPIGTTITLRNIFSSLPVRKRFHIKNSKKYISKIRKLLISYSLVFPTVRFVFKQVRMSNNDKKLSTIGMDIVLNPTKSLISKVIAAYGTKMIGELIEGKISNINSYDSWELQYVISKPSPHVSTERGIASTKTVIISVNSRILNPSLPLGKLITKKLSSIHNELLCHLPSFWYLGIVCPNTTLDVNIEPEKNDILFGNNEELLSFIDEGISSVIKANLNPEEENIEDEQLGESIVDEDIQPQHLAPISNKTPTSNDLNPPTTNNLTLSITNEMENISNTTSEKPTIDPTWKYHTYDAINHSSQELDNHPSSDTRFSNEDLDLSTNINLSNPFIMAKMNASQKKKSTSTQSPITVNPQQLFITEDESDSESLENENEHENTPNTSCEIRPAILNKINHGSAKLNLNRNDISVRSINIPGNHVPSKNPLSQRKEKVLSTPNNKHKNLTSISTPEITTLLPRCRKESYSTARPGSQPRAIESTNHRIQTDLDSGSTINYKDPLALKPIRNSNNLTCEINKNMKRGYELLLTVSDPENNKKLKSVSLREMKWSDHFPICIPVRGSAIRLLQSRSVNGIIRTDTTEYELNHLKVRKLDFGWDLLHF